MKKVPQGYSWGHKGLFWLECKQQGETETPLFPSENQGVHTDGSVSITESDKRELIRHYFPHQRV